MPNRDLVKIRVGVEFRAVLECEFLCFNNVMDIVTAELSHRLNVKMLQHFKHLLCRDALTIRREFPQRIAAVICANRLNEYGVNMKGVDLHSVFYKISLPQIASLSLHIIVDGLSDRAFVKAATSLFCNQAIGIGQSQGS